MLPSLGFGASFPFKKSLLNPIRLNPKPGCGKSTQLPQFLDEAGWTAKGIGVESEVLRLFSIEDLGVWKVSGFPRSPNLS